MPLCALFRSPLKTCPKLLSLSLGSWDETQAKLGNSRSTSYFVVPQQSDAFAPEENISSSHSLWPEVMKKNVSHNRATLCPIGKGCSSCWDVPASVQTGKVSLGLWKTGVATHLFHPNKQTLRLESVTTRLLDTFAHRRLAQRSLKIKVPTYGHTQQESWEEPGARE